MLFIKKGSIFLIDPENGEMFHPGRIRGKRHREQKTGHTLWGTAVLLYPAASAGFGVGDLRAALSVNPAAALPTGGEVHRRPLPAPQGRSSGKHPFGKIFSKLHLPDPAASYCNGEEGFLRRSFSAASESGRDSFPLISYALTSRKEEPKRSGLFLHVSIRHSIVQRAGPG